MSMPCCCTHSRLTYSPEHTSSLSLYSPAQVLNGQSIKHSQEGCPAAREKERESEGGRGGREREIQREREIIWGTEAGNADRK